MGPEDGSWSLLTTPTPKKIPTPESKGIQVRRVVWTLKSTLFGPDHDCRRAWEREVSCLGWGREVLSGLPFTLVPVGLRGTRVGCRRVGVLGSDVLGEGFRTWTDTDTLKYKREKFSRGSTMYEVQEARDLGGTGSGVLKGEPHQRPFSRTPLPRRSPVPCESWTQVGTRVRRNVLSTPSVPRISPFPHTWGTPSVPMDRIGLGSSPLW